MKPHLLAFLILLYSPLQFAQKVNNTEHRLERLSQDVEYAVLPVMDWGDPNDPARVPTVVGTAFLVNEEGYFVTAAHVLQSYAPKSHRLTVILRQHFGGGNGVWFDVVKKDTDHDIALCKFASGTLKTLHNSTSKLSPEFQMSYATLQVANKTPKTGEFIVLAGFPLGSWTPAIQLGTVAATETVSPTGGRVPAGQRDLLQIAVSGNQGNSGSPIVSFDSGQVIAVVIQEVVAPLFSQPNVQVPLAQSSGIMLAAPAKWVQQLLADNHVTSERVIRP
jgi:S1-C subfamily serine protease